MKLEKPIVDGKSADAAVVRALSTTTSQRRNTMSKRPTSRRASRAITNETSTAGRHTAAGYSLGSIIAVILSVIVNKSIFWGLVHLWCSWAYVVWALIMHLDTIKAFFVSV